MTHLAIPFPADTTIIGRCARALLKIARRSRSPAESLRTEASARNKPEHAVGRCIGIRWAFQEVLAAVEERKNALAKSGYD
jgi:hypothetical protein